ncbi:MAG: hypothetical protein LBG94_06100 [Treponema sp.]|jgi:GGDEF domain-containing protein|nr:hypothetical protein [Treponema sp.]
METENNKKTAAGKNGLAVAGSVIAAICIAIYLFALIQGAFRIYLSIDQRKITIEQEFDQIAGIAQSAGTRGFMDANFIQTINNALTASDSIIALIITGADVGYSFEKETGQAITWVNNQPRFINRFGFSDQNLYKPLSFVEIRNANIKAAASAFDYNEFSRILRETLLIILAGFAIAFITMLIQLIARKPVQHYVQTPEPVQKKTSQEAHSPQPDKKTRHVAETTTGIVSGTKRKTVQPKDETEDSEEEIPADTGLKNKKQAEPKGLYSPRSGIGWEDYIKDRLDSELHRCSSAEKDLVFSLMELDISDNDTYRSAAQEAANFFASKDLLFEYGKTGIAVVIPGITLDDGISKCENFIQRISDKLPDITETGKGLCVGLSSRSGRILNADRLILETTEALKRAKKDEDSSIIAFRSDPEKYREYIRTRA